ncbi:MAG TPA: NfeD family protein [Allocoleopsis sp.]
MFRFKSVAERRAVVAEPIRPNETGRVRFQGSWWSARCEQEVTLMPGTVVYVMGNRGIVLIVVPDSVLEAEVAANR